MSEINELKEKLITRRMKWMRSETTPDYVISDLIDLVLGITEHLEAQEKPCVNGEPCVKEDDLREMSCALSEQPVQLTVSLEKSIRREAMIKVLRKCGENTCVMDAEEYREWLFGAIARLENGGEL